MYRACPSGRCSHERCLAPTRQNDTVAERAAVLLPQECLPYTSRMLKPMLLPAQCDLLRPPTHGLMRAASTARPLAKTFRADIFLHPSRRPGPKAGHMRPGWPHQADGGMSRAGASAPSLSAVTNCA